MQISWVQLSLSLALFSDSSKFITENCKKQICLVVTAPCLVSERNLLGDGSHLKKEKKNPWPKSNEHRASRNLCTFENIENLNLEKKNEYFSLILN